MPEPSVVAWYLRQDSTALLTTTVTLAEVFYGLNVLPKGDRRNRLDKLAYEFFQRELDGKVLAFDEASAVHYGRIRAAKRLLGISMSPLDAQIAAIALSVGASVATRNVTDFEDCGVTIINPWGE